MSATFELKKTEEEAFYFHFLDKGGEMILMSAEFPSREEATEAIAEVRKGSLMSQQIAAGKVPEGSTFFVIKDSQGDIIVKSILFDDQMIFDNALHQVKDNACVAEIVDLT